jgi:hypothetical protein
MENMKISNPRELVGKQVFDCDGTLIGTIDKAWPSWDDSHLGWFFGIRLYENARDTWFRGTTKLVPIYNEYFKEIAANITLDKTLKQLAHLWNKAIPYDITTWPMNDLMERSIYDKNHSRIGICFGWEEKNGTYTHYGCFLDPFLYHQLNLPYNILLPLPPNYIHYVKDTITLNKTWNDLKKFWTRYKPKRQTTEQKKIKRTKKQHKNKPTKKKNIIRATTRKTVQRKNTQKEK